MECPTCGYQLDTEQEMRQHHTKVHGEPMPNRTCKGCESEFYDPKARLTYCPDCNPNAGGHKGNWKDAKETGSYRLCESEFEYYPSDKDGVYCPECVASADGLLPENPATSIDKISTECQYCGKEMAVHPSRLERQIRGPFCDLDCYGIWLSENVVGENHHQWEGGSIPYGKRWWRIRRLALARDDHKCQNCSKDKEMLGQDPDVHHIKRVRDFESPEDAHFLENAITLCRSCHRKVEAGNIDIPVTPVER